MANQHSLSLILSEGNAFATIIYSYNFVNDNGTDANANTNFNFVADFSDAAQITVTYNAFINTVAQALLSAPSVNGSTTILYNYFEGMPCANLAHCHYTQLTGNGVNVANI